MDAFTDMLDCLNVGRCTAVDPALWLQDWASEGAPHRVLCRPSELSTATCHEARRTAHALAFLLGILE
jgi:hypothetical protein